MNAELIELANPKLSVLDILTAQFYVEHAEHETTALISDADGCTYDGERISHIASYIILSIYNDEDTLPDLDELSDYMVGTKIPDQVAKMKTFFTENNYDSIIFPNDFGTKRDNKQKELFKDLKEIDGTKKFFKTLKDCNIPYALASRSRYQPMIDKLEVTGLSETFPEDLLFYKDKTDHELVNAYAIKHGIDLDGLETDKTREFIHAAAHLGIPPESCFCVEDTSSGILSIVNAKMIPILFLGADSTNRSKVLNEIEDLKKQGVNLDNLLIADRWL